MSNRGRSFLRIAGSHRLVAIDVDVSLPTNAPPAQVTRAMGASLPAKDAAPLNLSQDEPAVECTASMSAARTLSRWGFSDGAQVQHHRNGGICSHHRLAHRGQPADVIGQKDPGRDQHRDEEESAEEVHCEVDAAGFALASEVDDADTDREGHGQYTNRRAE